MTSLGYQGNWESGEQECWDWLGLSMKKALCAYEENPVSVSMEEGEWNEIG